MGSSSSKQFLEKKKSTADVSQEFGHDSLDFLTSSPSPPKTPPNRFSIKTNSLSIDSSLSPSIRIRSSSDDSVSSVNFTTNPNALSISIMSPHLSKSYDSSLSSFSTPRKSSVNSIKSPNSSIRIKTLEEVNITSSKNLPPTDNLTRTPRNNLLIIEETDNETTSSKEGSRRSFSDSFNESTDKKLYYVCKICSRKFTSENFYQSHCQYSKVHHIALLKCLNGKSRLDLNIALNKLNAFNSDDLSGMSGISVSPRDI